jgi:DNA-binding IclR family transcriptional regulator
MTLRRRGAVDSKLSEGLVSSKGHRDYYLLLPARLRLAAAVLIISRLLSCFRPIDLRSERDVE